MEYREALSDREKIKELKYELSGDHYFLKWKWTEEFDCVYIFKTGISEELSLDELLSRRYKVFTKEEYRNLNGYREKISEPSQIKYQIYPVKNEYDRYIVINQEPLDNCIVVCTGKPYIRYVVNESRRFFSRNKTVRITIYSEVDIDKDVLCYVKMSGRRPTGTDEGIIYPLYQDIGRGENIFPQIEVRIDEYVSLFFTDGKKYGEMYNLVQM